MDAFNLEEFWQLVVDVWTNGVFGIDIGQIIVAFGIFFVLMMVRNLFTQFVLRRLEKIVAKTDNEIDDTLVEALRNPIRFVPIVLGVFLSTSYLSLAPDLQQFATNLNRSLIAFTIFWALYRISDPLSEIMMRAAHVLTSSMIQWLAKAVKIAFGLLGAATILEIWGIQVGAIIAGLGLFGVAVALGAQDLFKNLIAGLFVIGERRFHPGDWILVPGIVEGTVEEIGFRTTTVRRFDKAPVYVPNAQLSDNAVTNFSRMTYRRIKWVIGLEYGSTGEQLAQIRAAIEEYVTSNKDFVQPSETSSFVRIDRFSDSSIDILLYCFTRTTDWIEWLAIKEKLLLHIKEVVEDAGTGFAFPSRTLYLEAIGEDIEVAPLHPTPQKKESS
ncbi:MAG: mechanosensitive ion channel family protein [Kordiimonadaceae bacterium]|nr:mechanosensitive ion channel family protein [Kordiimonadaceae bacterium]MBO6568986.1 mechanosensitive ion channel family protein [Kordiimonadaceae bacterium]MBO6964461.1 mechanosensitive ion channel family protein [Kordiimonadaceae bacterium]